MIEEVTKENIEKLLEMLPKNLTNIERLILTNEGTVQTMLSILFGVPISVEIIDQMDIGSWEGTRGSFASIKNSIVRWSKLVADCSCRTNLGCKVPVCHAQSVITSDNPGFITGIREKHMGIGQLISAKEIATRRKIKGIYVDDETFSRIYEIEDVCTTPGSFHIKCIITETFQRKLFREVPYGRTL